MEIHSSQLWSVLLDQGWIAHAAKEITGKNGKKRPADDGEIILSFKSLPQWTTG